MQCSRSVSINSIQSTPAKQRGRVGTLVLASALVIAAMYVGLKPAVGTKDLHASAAAVQTPAAGLTWSAQSAERAVEEVIVTAPRIAPTVLDFDAPSANIALTAPSAPKTYWQAPS